MKRVERVAERIRLGAAKSYSDMTPAMVLSIHEGSFYSVQISLVEKKGQGSKRQLGQITLRKGKEKPGVWVVDSSEAIEGWGPFLYDLAMEYATKFGQGLISDRLSVSEEAAKVWDYYHAKRSDVEHHPIPESWAREKLDFHPDDPVLKSYGAQLSRYYRKQPSSLLEALLKGSVRGQKGKRRANKDMGDGDGDRPGDETYGVADPGGQP